MQDLGNVIVVSYKRGFQISEVWIKGFYCTLKLIHLDLVYAKSLSFVKFLLYNITTMC